MQLICKPSFGEKSGLGPSNTDHWHAALFDLLTILGDDAEAYESIEATGPEQVEAMRRNWRAGADCKELRKRIMALRLIYDWPALKSVVRLCPGHATDRFKLNDLFNLMDMHIPPGSGFRGPVLREREGLDRAQLSQFLDVRRLVGAKNASRAPDRHVPHRLSGLH